MTKAFTITLPYPISANKYWRPVHIGKHITIVPTKEAKAFKTEIGWLCKAAGLITPMLGRVRIDIQLYPNRPQDWQKRMRLHGEKWDDTVMCIDLDNANKVLLDAFKGIAIEDDKWVRKINAERMEPDEFGARVIVTITQILSEQQQVAVLI